jgi:hypothetical protein
MGHLERGILNVAPGTTHLVLLYMYIIYMDCELFYAYYSPGIEYCNLRRTFLSLGVLYLT